MSRIILPCRSELAGFYRLQVRNGRTLKVKKDTGWFPNIITDQGLNARGSESNILGQTQVGSGTDAPATTDTALQSFVASTTTTQDSSPAAQASPPYYGRFRVTRRFDEGVAAGNLSEVGIGYGTSGSNTDPTNARPLFSRALILDALGNPTTITVLSNEVLDVTYELRNYPPLVDQEYAVDGYDIVSRAARVTSALGPVGETGWASGLSTGVSLSRQNIYNGEIGLITGTPSGNSTNTANPGASVSTFSYSNNSLERVGEAFFGLNANPSNNPEIRSLLMNTSGCGVFQFEFDPVISKDATKELTIGLQCSWARRTL